MEALQKWRISKTVKVLASSLHQTANHQWTAMRRLLFSMVLARDPRHSWGTPSARYKDVRLRTSDSKALRSSSTKRLRVRWEGWTCECCRDCYNAFRDSIWYVHSTSLTDLFLTFGLMRGSVLSALRRLLWNAIQSSQWSSGAFRWSYSGWSRCITT